jgi:hypothetical protein
MVEWLTLEAGSFDTMKSRMQLSVSMASFSTTPLSVFEHFVPLIRVWAYFNDVKRRATNNAMFFGGLHVFLSTISIRKAGHVDVDGISSGVAMESSRLMRRTVTRGDCTG